jgi:hypothetical protein
VLAPTATVCEVGVAEIVKSGVVVVGMISIPLDLGASAVPDVKETTTWPLLFAALVNCCTFALFAPPAAAMMSKFVSTGVLLMATLNVRWPTAVQ